MRLWERHRPAPETLRQLAATPGIATQWQRKIVERADWLDKQLTQSGATATAFHVKPKDR